MYLCSVCGFLDSDSCFFYNYEQENVQDLDLVSDKISVKPSLHNKVCVGCILESFMVLFKSRTRQYTLTIPLSFSLCNWWFLSSLLYWNPRDNIV